MITITYISIHDVNMLVSALKAHLANGVVHLAAMVKDNLNQLWLDHFDGKVDVDDMEHLYHACLEAIELVDSANEAVKRSVDVVEFGKAFDIMWETYAKDCKSRAIMGTDKICCLSGSDPLKPLPDCQFNHCPRFTDEG
jgi:hypothetical protein